MKKLFFLLATIFLFAFTTITQTQTVTTIVAGPSTFNDGLALDAEGNIYAARYYSSTVTKITPAGETSIFADGFENPNGIAFDKDYNLYVPNATGNKIHKVTPDGSISLYQQITGPSALLFDREGNLYIAHYSLSKITKIDTGGNQSIFWTGNGLNGPIGLVIDNEGNFYAGNFNDGKIFKRTPTGEVTQIGDIPGWMGFMTLAGDAIYSTAYQQNKIFKVPTNGSGQLVFAGTGAVGQTDGDVLSATFSNPNGIVATTTGDTLYISDYQTRSLRMITGVNNVTNIELEDSQPSGYKLEQNYPNPFNPTTKIKFSIPVTDGIHVSTTNTKLTVYDLLGNEIKTLLNINLHSGIHEVEFTAENLTSGVYYYKLKAGNFVKIKKMILLK